MRINRMPMRRRKRAQILTATQKKRRKRRKSPLSRCGPYSGCPYHRNSRSI
jgi:hypothetical protein